MWTPSLAGITGIVKSLNGPLKMLFVAQYRIHASCVRNGEYVTLSSLATVITPPHPYLHEDVLTSRRNHSVQFPVGW